MFSGWFIKRKKSEIRLMGWPIIILWFRFTWHGLNCDFGGAAAVTTTNTSKTILLYFPDKDGTFCSFQLYYIWCRSSGTFVSWVFRDCGILCSLYLGLVTFCSHPFVKVPIWCVLLACDGPSIRCTAAWGCCVGLSVTCHSVYSKTFTRHKVGCICRRTEHVHLKLTPAYR